MNIHERFEALRMKIELSMKEIEALQVLAKQDGENIRVLLRIAEIHELQSRKK
jgi:hypothetical protein